MSEEDKQKIKNKEKNILKKHLNTKDLNYLLADCS